MEKVGKVNARPLSDRAAFCTFVQNRFILTLLLSFFKPELSSVNIFELLCNGPVKVCKHNTVNFPTLRMIQK